mmetsp:Transcript_113034/g.359115  ORF Transcript_113034/g.359115 Transcript_113034/m.359115 type:complete len:204 (-) Transcript_113034:180-791(-)
MDALEQTLMVGVHVGASLHEASDALFLRDGIRHIDSCILLRKHHEGRSRGTHLRANALEADLLQALTGHRLCARPDQAQRVNGPGSLGGLGEGGPAGHEDDLAADAVVVQSVVLCAEPIETLLEVLQVAPGLGLHVQRPVHARQPLPAFLQGLQHTHLVAPNGADIGQDGLRGVLGLVVDDHRRERRRRQGSRCPRSLVAALA